MKKHVELTFDRNVVIVTMDSPPVNAFTEDLHRDFASAIDTLGARNDIRAIIVTGTGAYFQAGGDINRFLTIHSVEDARAFVDMAQGFMDRIAGLAPPTIAAVNGYALGGGLEIALACDLRVASRGASFALPEVRFGILAGAGGTQRLARLIGPGRAKRMMFTGQRIDADEALRIGLVEAVVEADQLIPACLKLAHEIAGNSPMAARLIKKCVDEGLNVPLAAGLKLERDYWVSLVSHGDYREGVRAWLDRRAPSFSDPNNISTATPTRADRPATGA